MLYEIISFTLHCLGPSAGQLEIINGAGRSLIRDQQNLKPPLTRILVYLAVNVKIIF